MNATHKITLPFADLAGQKVLEKRTHFMELGEKHLRWVYEAWANYQPEDKEIWRERLLSYDYMVKKEFITQVGLSYSESADPEDGIGLWKLTLSIWAAEDIVIYFKKEANAREVLDVLTNYYLL